MALVSVSSFAMVTSVIGYLKDDRDDQEGSHQKPEVVCIHVLVFLFASGMAISVPFGTEVGIQLCDILKSQVL